MGFFSLFKRRQRGDKFNLSSSSRTHTGQVRTHNEDVCLADDASGYFLVADGMGGAAAGEVASGIFMETTQKLFSPGINRSEEELKKLLLDCFYTANNSMLKHVEEEPACKGMGCTAELLAFSNNDFLLGHVGDSRTYRLRDGELHLLTTDHTLVQAQEDLGLISREQAQKHPMQNVILRVVGKSKELEVDIIKGAAQLHDIYLLCSDGLTSMVDDEKIIEILSFKGPLDLKTTMLVDQANYAGGTDNISVVLIEIG